MRNIPDKITIKDSSIKRRGEKKGIWTGRYWMTKEKREKISSGLKEYYKTHQVWSKGKKFSKYDEPSSKRLRRNEEYRLRELEKNAKRNVGINKDPERRKEIEEWHKKMQELSGAGRTKKDWSDEEKLYLEENWGKIKALSIAIELSRSFSSVCHKAERLGLRYYNKWN